MRPLPYVIIAVVVVLAALRVRRLRRRRQQEEQDGGSARAAAPARARRGGHRPPLLGDTGLVAAREIRERLRGRFLKIITLILLVVVAAAIIIPKVSASPPRPQKIGVVGQLSAAERHGAASAAAKAGAPVDFVDQPDLTRARAHLAAGQLDAVVVGGQSLLVKAPVAAGDTTARAQAVRAVSTSLGVADALQAAALSPSQAAALAGAKPLPITSLEPPARNTTARSTAVIGIVLVFIMLTQYNTWTLMGVMEEKSSRVVEVLLATIRPIELLAGKLLGIGLVALAQAGLVVAFALALAAAVGSSLLSGAAPMVLVAGLIWLVLGYGFYSWVFAAAGSMAERQDQVQGLVLPLSIPIILGYVVALSALGSDHPSLLVQVLAYFPPTAPFAMTVLVAAGTATWWEFALSAAISVAGTVAVARLAAAVYRRAVLRTGGRVHLRDLVASGR